MRALRLAASCAPCRPAQPDTGAHRLRCVLCYRRETRQSGHRRQTGDHRRRQARRGVGGLLYRTDLRRALGDADVQGARSLSVRCRDSPRHGEIRSRRPRGAQRHAGADPAGRAAVDRRGVSRSRRHPAAARHGSGQGAGAIRKRRRTRHRHHRLGRAVGQQVHCQDCIRSRQAPRLRHA